MDSRICHTYMNNSRTKTTGKQNLFWIWIKYKAVCAAADRYDGSQDLSMITQQSGKRHNALWISFKGWFKNRCFVSDVENLNRGSTGWVLHNTSLWKEKIWSQHVHMLNSCCTTYKYEVEIIWTQSLAMFEFRLHYIGIFPPQAPPYQKRSGTCCVVDTCTRAHACMYTGLIPIITMRGIASLFSLYLGYSSLISLNIVCLFVF